MKAVVFDMDGVLVNFNIDSRRIKTEIIEYFEGSGFPKGVLSPALPFSKIKGEVERHFFSKGMRKDQILEILRAAEGMAVEHEVEAARTTRLLPGAKETVSALKAMGVRLAIFTYNNSRAVRLALERLGLEGYFDAVVSRDQVENPKPSPCHLMRVLELLGVSADEALVVGDSEMDIRPAKELGVRVAAITTGVRSEEELRAHAPDYIVKGLPEVIEIVMKG
ncbi:MAG: HAD family hydrolase [Candidatus Verstraetearchaeota archaeon]|nr:HAD family hydrolase [Candidatus Verstraetearchaeota archaeon]